ADTAPAPIPDKPAGVLVLIDYADRWPPEDLLELLTRPEASRGRVRMLLLGRSGAFWPPLSQPLGRAGIGISQRRLEPLAERESARGHMSDPAATASAHEPHPSVEPVTSGPSLSGSGFGLTLAVHIAALVTVLRRRDGHAGPQLPDEPALDDPAALSRELLIREVRHWESMTQRRVNRVRLSTKQMARAVLIATLTRGLPAPSARKLLEQVRIGTDPQDVIDDHALCYPSSRGDIVLEPLYPDRLGEDLIAALLPGGPADEHDSASLDFLADPASPTILATLLQPTPTPATASISTLTVLLQAPPPSDHLPHPYLLPVLHESGGLLLGCGGAVIERAAAIAAIAATLPGLGSALDRIIGPGTHLSLGIGAAA